MRYIASLQAEEVQQLQEILRVSEKHRERMRAQALLLSHKGYKLKVIADICQVDRDTVSHWRPSHGLQVGTSTKWRVCQMPSVQAARVG